jgi:ATP-dependent DNA helicase RecQ
MPKIQKKPMKKAVSRASSAKSRRAAPVTKAKPKARIRSVLALGKPKPKAQVAAKPKPKAARNGRATAKPKAKPPARAKAKAARVPARTLILPPKPKRITGRVAPLPPRAPRIVETETELESISKGTSARSEAVVLRMRERGHRPLVTAEAWRRLEEAAARSGQRPLSEPQRSAIAAALEGRDTVVVIPDDARAVACYQLCAPLLEQPTVVLSPLPSELQAQSEALSADRKPVVCLLPETSGPERSAALTRIGRGGPLLVLLSPEALSAADVQKALEKSGIALFVVEEAHCASEFSHEVRPSYAELGRVLEQLGKPPVMALTRVATARVLREISARLLLTAPVMAQAPAVRDNLRIVTRLARGEGRQASLVRLLERLEPPGLVLCASPHEVDSVYSALRGSSITAYRYHGGMTPSDRAVELLNFTLPGEHGVMVAVSAFAAGSGLPGLGEPASPVAAGFGRGSTKPDLRFVVHYQSPASIEQYLREIQHAGRDGQPATCVLFHESSHRSLHEVMLAQQRFRATHLAELGRVLEAPALEGRTVTLESLALATGQSRRTTDRLTALLADAGVVSKVGGWVQVLSSASDLLEACRRLGAQLYALREQDGHRLVAVSAFAESNDCKLGFLDRYLGEAAHAACGRCSACSSDLSATESMPPQAAARRALVQEFSVRGVAVADASAPLPALGTPPFTAKMADFGAVMPRAGR